MKGGAAVVHRSEQRQDLAVETVTSGLFSPMSSKALEQELLKQSEH